MPVRQPREPIALREYRKHVAETLRYWREKMLLGDDTMRHPDGVGAQANQVRGWLFGASAMAQQFAHKDWDAQRAISRIYDTAHVEIGQDAAVFRAWVAQLQEGDRER